MAAAIFSVLSMKAASIGGAKGMAGTSGPANRVTGPSRYSNASSAMIPATSAPMPPAFVSSWTMSAFPVFCTDARTVSRSMGRTVRRSTTSALMPSCASSSRRLYAVMHHQPVRDDAQVFALQLHVGLADGHRVVLFGHLAANEAVRPLVLQEYHRIVAADGALEQTLRIVWSGRSDDLESRRVREERLDALGVV